LCQWYPFIQTASSTLVTPYAEQQEKQGIGGEKKRAAAPQAAAETASGHDSFPKREMRAQTLQRILGYEYVSDKDDRPIRIRMGFISTLYEYLDGDGRRFVVNTSYLHQNMSNLLPDYDRNAAEYPIAMGLMEVQLKSTGL
jgi:hypothetical protein